MEEWIYYHPDMHRELTPEEKEEFEELFWENERIFYGEDAQNI